MNQPYQDLSHLFEDFQEGAITRRYPNAARHLRGGIFISHDGDDSQRIREEIISPVILDRFPGDRYFFHSRTSGGSVSYRELVTAALHWCDKFLVVVSRRALVNRWVRAEVDWAAHHRPSIIHCII